MEKQKKFLKSFTNWDNTKKVDEADNRRVRENISYLEQRQKKKKLKTV